MENKYLEKVADALLGAVGGYKASREGDKKGGAVAGAVTGGLVGGAISSKTKKLLEHGGKNLAKMPAAKIRPAHLGALGVVAAAGAMASGAGAYIGGRLGGKYYSRAKAKLNEKK